MKTIIAHTDFIFKIFKKYTSYETIPNDTIIYLSWPFMTSKNESFGLKFGEYMVYF